MFDVGGLQKYYRLALIAYIIVCQLMLAVRAQRPLINHTSYNSIPTSQHNNYKLRNGRTHDIAPIPPSTVASMPPRKIIYEEYDSTSLPPLGGRRGNNRRRLNLANLGSYGPRGSNTPRYGIESLRKELMKASVGGPGGGISDHPDGYPSYVATSSIGKISGLGSLGPANRYGDKLQTVTILTPSASLYSTNIPPAEYLLGHHQVKLNSITNLKKLNGEAKQRNNSNLIADEPAKRLTDDIILDPNDDLLNAVRDKLHLSTLENSSLYVTHIEELLGVRCTFETECGWKWNEGLVDGFYVTNGIQVKEKNITGLYPGPLADRLDDANGHFLYARLLPSTEQVNLTSPEFSTTMERCFLEVYIHQSGMSHGLFSVVVKPLDTQENPWVPAEMIGDNNRQWSRKYFKLGRITRNFQIVFEIVPKLAEGQKAHVAIDNLRMVNCFPEGTKADKCAISQVKCMLNKAPVCIPSARICDITKDCDDAEDELLNCDKIPYGGRCDFENDWCGWRDSGKTILSWSRHTGSSPTYDTGPEGDHTYQHLYNTTGGYYMLVNMNQHSNNTEKGALIGFASNAVLISKTFNPPPLVHGNPNSPYRNSCVVRFYIHQFGKNPGSINLSVVEMKETENITTTLWWSTKNQGENWLRAEYILPNITSRYYLQFEARMGMRIFSDVAVDDFSLSPECFGINIPKDHLNGYNYWDIHHKHRSPSHRDFEDKNYLELTTCDTRGMIGPTQQQCEYYYNSNNKSHVLKEVHVIEEQMSYKGMQKWKVPHEGYYTIIAKGAGGGLGSSGIGSSRGAVAVSVFELHKNEELYVLVGQQGEHACKKSSDKEDECSFNDDSTVELNTHLNAHSSKSNGIDDLYSEHGAGGGGGASYVFLLNSAKNEAIPLVVAGGGGGLGFGLYNDEDFQHGQKANASRHGVTGQIHGEALNRNIAGPGGGWRAKPDQALDPKFGAALLQGGRGGHSCYMEKVSNGTLLTRHGEGGFGGGGGGCDSGGGGGGGYSGGDVYLNVSNGEGGTSFISNSRNLKDFNAIYEGVNSGAGAVFIIAAIEGCGCDYRCIALDEFRSTVHCICPDGWRLKRDNNTACEMIYEERIPFSYLIGFFIVLVVLLGVSLTSLIVILYNRYQRKKQAKLRHVMLLEQDVQLSRLRHNVEDSNLNNFNPNYGCDGILNGHVDVNSLPQVARESLRLVKALGQGAFGEVYQGLYRHRDGDAVEMPVAVKTLPEMSTRQAEEDFLMEAAIMAKFNHPNMVHLIGVCFDRHPRFIVLELLAGGDLKNFLREGRSKPERPSPLTMKDLVFCALDVAKGCHYMESKRFIHRDIAARNCLLSSKGPGRVVKIADFGMARDIYRSDYYRKGGKAMLPIKWMPPEAFLDGIFTSKTDVWSFGVLLWEVFSLGLMPYTGLPNPEVMQLVTNGGRLGSPPGCPSAIYKIMADCWNPTPEDRPTFSNLLERLTACTQDPNVMNAPLPCIIRPPSSERDQTIMRPPRSDEFCLQVPHTDYLIPLPGIHHTEEYTDAAPRSIVAVSTGTDVCTPPDISPPSAPQTTSEDGRQICENSGGNWETSFILTNSKSNELLLNNTLDIQRHDNVNDAVTQVNNGGNSNYNSATLRLLSNENSAQSRSAAGGKMTQKDERQKENTQEKEEARQGSGEVEEEETKLISLDTPQPTPTAIQPPLSFSTQLDGITLDPATLTKNLNNSTNNKRHCSYANLQLSTNNVVKKNQLHCMETKLTEKLNGIIPQMLPSNGNNNNINGCIINTGNSNTNTNSNSNTIANTNTSGLSSVTITSANAGTPPFTIQGYSERFKDSHSEISC